MLPIDINANRIASEANGYINISGHKSHAALMRDIKVDNKQEADRLKGLRDELKR